MDPAGSCSLLGMMAGTLQYKRAFTGLGVRNTRPSPGSASIHQLWASSPTQILFYCL